MASPDQCQVVDGAEEEQSGGELLYCGVTRWDAVGRNIPYSDPSNLISPTRLRPLLGVNIRSVAAGCSSVHCAALDVNGHCYTWGRNEKGQLGHGDLIQRDVPTIVAGLSKYKIVKVGAGRQHTVVVTEDGSSFAFGWNKHGQLGSGSLKNEVQRLPIQCLVSKVTNVVCGADFTMWLSSIEGASILSAGLPQYGQLGHGSDHEYNAKQIAIRLAYAAQPYPRAIAALSEKTITKVACGNNHTVAVDSNGFVYTWGFGGYGRLGHREQKDEWIPRMIEVFQRRNVLPPSAVLAVGATFSSCTAGGGQLYMWGRVKNFGECWMYPKPLFDLSGWAIRCMDSGYTHSVCGADDSCISWGFAYYGELGYGSLGPRTSANPKKIDILEGMNVLSVACGFSHSLIVVDRTNVADRIEKLDVYDGKNPSEVTVAINEDAANVKDSSGQSGKKRKASSKEAIDKITPKNKKNARKKSSKKKSLSGNCDDDYDSKVANNSMKKTKQANRRGGNHATAAAAIGHGKATKDTGLQVKKSKPTGKGRGKGRSQ